MKTSSFTIFSLLLLLAQLICTAPLSAKIDLVTLPEKEGVKLTIYNSHDLTLVKESRILTFRQGDNKLQFSWAGTKIDPTSLEFKALEKSDQLQVIDISYPKNTQDTLVWTLKCSTAGQYPVEISYFTSGLSWRAQYLLLSNSLENSLDLKLYVTLANHSGEDFEGANTRLVVGKLNLVEQIADLAGRDEGANQIAASEEMMDGERMEKAMAPAASRMMERKALGRVAMKQEKVIHKEGLSEYFLYTIDGEEDIKSGWGKKLINLKKEGVPFEAYYKYDPDQWGEQVRRFFRFTNVKESKLGEEPLPDGSVVVYRRTDGSGTLELLGQTAVRYIPIGQKEDLDLGPEKEMTLKRRLMDYQLADFTYDYKGNIAGWNEIKYYEIEVKNLRPTKNKLEIKNHFENKRDGEALTPDKPLKDDYRTLKYDLILDPYEVRKVGYKIIQYQGKNGENK